MSYAKKKIFFVFLVQNINKDFFCAKVYFRVYHKTQLDPVLLKFKFAYNLECNKNWKVLFLIIVFIKKIVIKIMSKKTCSALAR